MNIICTIRAAHEHPDLTHTRWAMGTAELKRTHHTGGAPDVGRRAVVGPDQDLHRAVLARLDVLSEVLVLGTGQTQVPCTPSGQKYGQHVCLLTTQQALPRSAILMAILWAFWGLRRSRGGVGSLVPAASHKKHHYVWILTRKTNEIKAAQEDGAHREERTAQVAPRL